MSTMLWGVNGHFDQGGPYSNISINQQIQDLHTVFGSSGKVLYRAVQDDETTAAAAAEIQQLQGSGIEPIVNVVTYPPFATFADQAAAYNWAYAKVSAFVKGASAANYYEIGNEWTINSPTNTHN